MYVLRMMGCFCLVRKEWKVFSVFFFYDIYFSQLKGALSSREREIASLRRQLDQSQEELSTVSRDREVALRENRRLQDDLATMTRENQVHTSR